MSSGRWKMRRTSRRQLIVGAVTVVAPVVAGAVWPARYLGRLYPGVKIAGLDLGGLTRAEAANRLDAHLASFLTRPVTFRLGERTWPATATDLGVRVDLNATLEQACRYGRAGGLSRRYTTLLDPEDARTNVPVVVEVDMAKLQAFLDDLDREIERAPRDAELVLNGTKAEIRPDRAGRRLETAAMRDAVMEVVETLTSAEIAVATRPVEASVTAARLAEAQTVAATLTSDPVVVTRSGRTWTVTVDDLAAALVLPDDPVRTPPSLDENVLVDRLAPIAEEVDDPPRDATVAWDDGLYALSPSAAGVEVDLEALAADVAAAALTDARSVELRLRSIPPAVDSENLEALGISRLVASGSSSFEGSSDARSTNIRVAAKHVSQTVIPPGGVFSFNDALGPITLEEGYVEGKIISGNWFANDLGGGVCQVSTTVYRAALLAGLPFEEWHPHSFRLGFYELDGWPPGMDAAIYQPNTPDEWELDLLVANPTDAWLLLQMRVDGDVVAAELYGGNTRFDVTISDPEIGKAIPPPEPVERASPDLPTGARELAQTAQPGVTVTMTRTVRRNGDVLIEDTFVSPYEPQPEVWLVGTKGD